MEEVATNMTIAVIMDYHFDMKWNIREEKTLYICAGVLTFPPDDFFSQLSHHIVARRSSLL